MTVNQPNHEVTINIGTSGLGAISVPHSPETIEMVRVLERHGVPHVLSDTSPNKAWIEVLGAVPESPVTVVYYTES